jgi:protein-disulfide isomerase
MNRAALLAGAGGILIGASAMVIAGGSGLGPTGERAEIEGIVRDYILANPEILPEAMRLLQEREVAKVVDANRQALETPFGSAWAGAKDADVVLVEFFDYACGFCRKSNADVERLLEEDKNLKVVWREWPVLGQDSLAAAEASLAAASQGRFRDYHDRLFARGRPTIDAVAAVNNAVGVAPASASPDFRREIEKNYELARSIGATGTPTFVVGDKVLQGAVGYDALKQAVAEARRSS